MHPPPQNTRTQFAVAEAGRAAFEQGNAEEPSALHRAGPGGVALRRSQGPLPVPARSVSLRCLPVPLRPIRWGLVCNRERERGLCVWEWVWETLRLDPTLRGRPWHHTSDSIRRVCQSLLEARIMTVALSKGGAMVATKQRATCTIKAGFNKHGQRVLHVQYEVGFWGGDWTAFFLDFFTDLGVELLHEKCLAGRTAIRRPMSPSSAELLTSPPSSGPPVNGRGRVEVDDGKPGSGDDNGHMDRDSASCQLTADGSGGTSVASDEAFPGMRTLSVLYIFSLSLSLSDFDGVSRLVNHSNCFFFFLSMGGMPTQ